MVSTHYLHKNLKILITHFKIKVLKNISARNEKILYRSVIDKFTLILKLMMLNENVYISYITNLLDGDNKL